MPLSLDFTVPQFYGFFVIEQVGISIFADINHVCNMYYLQLKPCQSVFHHCSETGCHLIKVHMHSKSELTYVQELHQLDGKVVLSFHHLNSQ